MQGTLKTESESLYNFIQQELQKEDPLRQTDIFWTLNARKDLQRYLNYKVITIKNHELAVCRKTIRSLLTSAERFLDSLKNSQV